MASRLRNGQYMARDFAVLPQIFSARPRVKSRSKIRQWLADLKPFLHGNICAWREDLLKSCPHPGKGAVGPYQ